MLDSKKINEIVQQIIEAMPEGLRNLPKDLQKELRSGLTMAFAKLDLVTREEFDVQAAVLLRTRNKLIKLENRLSELEQKLANKEQAASE